MLDEENAKQFENAVRERETPINPKIDVTDFRLIPDIDYLKTIELSLMTRGEADTDRLKSPSTQTRSAMKSKHPNQFLQSLFQQSPQNAQKPRKYIISPPQAIETSES